MEYAPQVVPAPIFQEDGTTLYPGETTPLVTDPTVVSGDPPAGTGINHDSDSQCSTSCSTTGPNPLCCQEFWHPTKGYLLTSYSDTGTNEVWLHDPILDSMSIKI